MDSAFLDEIEGWREALARDIARNNEELSQPALNWSVQQTIDRIIFLRIAEDRGIEPYGQLQALQNGTSVYARLKALFQKADDRYNSGLFHFRKEPDRLEEPDQLTPGLDIEDKTLKDIFKHLYYPDSPYEFSVLGADILGSVYERFLGKVIRLTEGHHAKIEEKPEVKKAGGVFYTPTYIVNYIVQHTVGKLLEGMTPKEAEKLRILDPACGSGSFLIGAYQYLLDWHHDWYVKDGADKHAKGNKPKLHQGRGGAWRLTTSERKRILVNNLYGVDIDSQAVEVTKLSLLLKVLEGETQLEMFHERVLPDLGSNIKCGNSLIGSEFYQTQLIPLDDATRRRINAFDWNEEFPDVFKPAPSGRGWGEGGFDAVIGNPPYVRIQVMKEWAPEDVEYYKTQYLAASKGNYDIYVVFVEKGLSLLNKTGRLGFILPHKFFNAQYGEPLRLLISQGKHLAEVVHFGDQQVFDDASTYTCLLFLDKGKSKSCHVTKVDDLDAWKIDSKKASTAEIQSEDIGTSDWVFSSGEAGALFDRLQGFPTKLGDLNAKIFQGIITGADKVFVLEKRDNRLWSKCLDEYVEVEKDILRPLLKGQEIRRYAEPNVTYLVIFPYVVRAGNADLITDEQLRTKYPKTLAYLRRAKAFLSTPDREKKGTPLHAFGRNQNIGAMPNKKIMLQVLAKSPSFTIDENGKYVFVGGGTAGGYGISLSDGGVPYLYLLGLLNSRLLDFFHKKIATPFAGGFFAYSKQYLEQLPIVVPTVSEKSTSSLRDSIISLVERMFGFYKQLAGASTPHEQEALKRQIEATDRQIDKLVYELYGLTDEEIKIVEGTT